MVKDRITLGTRGSALARWQTDHVAGLLRAAWPGMTVEIQVITTQGDRNQETPLPSMGGKGVFTEELETALRHRTIDFAVHSLKDLPTESPSGLIIGATPTRAPAHDILVSRSGGKLSSLPAGAVVGTCSRRRTAQLLYRRPDLRTADIRGNVDTRIRKALDPAGSYDAIILAAAGVERLGRRDAISDQFPLDDMLPAPGQGALAVQCRDEDDSRQLLAPINHLPTQLAVTAERAFLSGLGGGCALPVAAYGEVKGDSLNLLGRVTAPDGSEEISVRLIGTVSTETVHISGNELALMALDHGANRLLEGVK